MDIKNFEKELANVNLTKKEFAKLVGAVYNGVVNWNLKGQTPKWVDSWIQNYKYKHFYEIVKEEFEKSTSNV